MKQAIKDCRDDDLIVKEFGPIGECLVGGQDSAGLLIAVGNEPEKEIAFLPVDGRVSDLINDHKRRFVIASPSAGAACLVVFPEFSDEVLHGSEVHT